MFTKRYGEGEKIFVGLHGWGGDHSIFEPLIKYLPTDASFVSFDLPGYGRSAAPAAWHLDSLAEEITSGIQVSIPNPCTIVGNCSGAILGFLSALRLQGTVSRLFAIDPFAYLPWYFKVFTRGQFGRIAYKTTFASAVGRWITNLVLASRRTSGSNLTQSFSQVNHEAALQYLILLSGISSLDRFRQLLLPTDIAYGQKTFKAVRQSAQQWQKIWPHARMWELKSAGHLPIEETPDQLAAVLFGSTNAQ